MDGFGLKSIRGYAAPHDLVIELGSVPPRPVLLLTGWTDYAFSSDNVAAHQAGLGLTPPALDVRDAEGRWRPAIADIGIPVGRPQTIVVDLAPVLRAGEHTVRDHDEHADLLGPDLGGVCDRRAGAADHAARSVGGAPQEPWVLTARSVPEEQNRRSTTTTASRPNLRGRRCPGCYTREGDVKSLLSSSDDMFVIAKPGDEIAVSFDASPVRPLPAGWTRTFLLKGTGSARRWT